MCSACGFTRHSDGCPYKPEHHHYLERETKQDIRELMKGLLNLGSKLEDSTLLDHVDDLYDELEEALEDANS